MQNNKNHIFAARKKDEMTEKRVYIKVHPAAARYLMLTQTRKGDGIKLTDRTVRDVFESCLGRTNFKGESHVARGYDRKYVRISVIVPDRVFYSLGYEMARYWQGVFSAFVYGRLMDEICMTVMANALAGRANRLWTIEEYLISAGITDELKTETVRKHYLRHWRKREQAAREIGEAAGVRRERKGKYKHR